MNYKRYSKEGGQHILHRKKHRNIVTKGIYLYRRCFYLRGDGLQRRQ